MISHMWDRFETDIEFRIKMPGEEEVVGIYQWRRRPLFPSSITNHARWLNIIAREFFTATNWTSRFLKELNDTSLTRMIERCSSKRNESKTFGKQTQCIRELLRKSSDLSPFNINSIYYSFYSAVKKEDCQCGGVAVIQLLKKVVIQWFVHSW